MLISLIIAVIITVLGAYVASNNLTPTELNVLGYPLRGTIGMMMVSALGAGVVLGVLMMLPALIGRSWSLIRHKRKLQDLEDTMTRGHVEEEPEEE